MRIILKPGGAIVMILAIGSLAFIALRSQKKPVLPSTNSVAAPLTNVSKGIPADSSGTVYSDGLRNGWANYSWAKIDLADKSLTAPGMAVRVESKKFDALYFHHEPIVLANYDRLTFRIHGGNRGGQGLKVVAQIVEKNSIQGGKEFLLSNVSANRWETVTVPLKDLGIGTTETVVGFWFQEGYGKTLPPYFIDDVRFLHPDEAKVAKE